MLANVIKWWTLKKHYTPTPPCCTPSPPPSHQVAVESRFPDQDRTCATCAGDGLNCCTRQGSPRNRTFLIVWLLGVSLAFKKFQNVGRYAIYPFLSPHSPTSFHRSLNIHFKFLSFQRVSSPEATLGTGVKTRSFGRLLFSQLITLHLEGSLYSMTHIRIYLDPSFSHSANVMEYLLLCTGTGSNLWNRILTSCIAITTKPK